MYLLKIHLGLFVGYTIVQAPSLLLSILFAIRKKISNENGQVDERTTAKKSKRKLKSKSAVVNVAPTNNFQEILTREKVDQRMVYNI